MSKPAAKTKSAPKRSHADQVNTSGPEQEVEDEGAVADEEEATPEQLATIVNLSREQIKLGRELVLAEKEVDRVNDLLVTNMTDTLPKAMRDAKLDHSPLGGGAEVSLDEVIRANIPSPNNKKNPTAVEDNAKGIAYMDEQAPDLVDNILTMKFERDSTFFNSFMNDPDMNTITLEFDRENKCFYAKFTKESYKRKRLVSVDMVRTVHTSRLVAWVKRRIEAAQPVDDQLLNVQRTWIAKVLLPKSKKDKDSIKT